MASKSSGKRVCENWHLEIEGYKRWRVWKAFGKTGIHLKVFWIEWLLSKNIHDNSIQCSEEEHNGGQLAHFLSKCRDRLKSKEIIFFLTWSSSVLFVLYLSILAQLDCNNSGINSDLILKRLWKSSSVHS